jgi:signal peptidase I
MGCYGLRLRMASKSERQANIRWWVITLAAVFVVRGSIVEPYSIPSGSMEPTVEIGDHLIVEKFAYGLRFLGMNDALFTYATPKRGDIVVLINNEPDGPDLLKRVVAIPGDRVTVTSGWLYLNGQKLPAEPISDPCHITNENGPSSKDCLTFRESLPGGVQHRIYRTRETLDYPARAADQSEIEVPPGSVFLMGDNRDESQDARFWPNHFVKVARLKGRAVFIGWAFTLNGGAKLNFQRWVSTLR